MRCAFAVLLGMLFVLANGWADGLQSAISTAQTVDYCAVINNPRAFADKVIRVRALYQTNFEQSALTAPACPSWASMTWVHLEKSWESRTNWRVRRAIGSVEWGIQTDVVFVGRFMSAGSLGHQGIYSFLIEVYKVESVKPSGGFRPLPDTGRNRE